MIQVKVEIFFPISRAVKKDAPGKVSLPVNLNSDQSVRDLMAYLAKRYRGLRRFFDLESRELSPMVWLTLNDTILSSPDQLDIGLKDDDSFAILPEFAGGYLFPMPSPAASPPVD